MSKVKNNNQKYSFLKLISPYLILGLVIYYPYILFIFPFIGFPDGAGKLILNWFAQGFILSSIVFFASSGFLYFIKTRKQLNIYLFISLLINLVLITSLIFYIFTPMLDYFVYNIAQNKLCSNKTASAIGDTSGKNGLEVITSFCNRVALAPRDKIISYTVAREDTVGIIAQQFNISSDTIRWENNLRDANLVEGQMIRILPVTGITHIVGIGDTIDYLANKYKTDKQKIIDYPFNDYADPVKFTLIPGTTIIIPDGKK